MLGSSGKEVQEVAGSADRYVWYAGVRWDSVRGTDQNLAAQLARSVELDYVEPPLSVLRGPLRAPGSLVGDSLGGQVLRHRTLAIPGARFAIVRRSNTQLVRRSVRRLLRSRPTHALVSTCLDPILDLADRPTVRVLVGTDDYVAGAELMDLPTGQLVAQERVALRDADVITAVSAGLAARWERLADAPVRLLPNGVDAALYADVPARRQPEGAEPTAILIGNITERLDIELLEAIPEAGMRLLLVGPHRPSFQPSRFTSLVGHPLVAWAGPVSFDQLPGWLARADVGITPYTHSEFNAASYPLKTLEYLAAGLPAVSTSLPAVSALGTDLVTTADAPRDFVAAIRQAASRSRDPEEIRARQDLARANSWASRAGQLQQLIDDHVPR